MHNFLDQVHVVPLVVPAHVPTLSQLTETLGILEKAIAVVTLEQVLANVPAKA